MKAKPWETVDGLMTHYDYTREDAEREIQRANCEHDFGKMCEDNPLGGCIRTCQKCGQKQCLPAGCTPRRTTSAKP